MKIKLARCGGMTPPFTFNKGSPTSVGPFHLENRSCRNLLPIFRPNSPAVPKPFCRFYLSNGRRQGRYWTVGDVRNTPGRSMFVRLRGPASGPGAAGRWTDAATAEFGDLLDVIRESCGLTDFRDVAEEARRFLNLPRVEPSPFAAPVCIPGPAESAEVARRLIAISQPIGQTLVETYLGNRGIQLVRDAKALRYHPRCTYRPEGGSPAELRPAMIAAVTDLGGRITGVHRTWLAPDGSSKAPIGTPRRAMGSLVGTRR
ncbi:MAG: hypothetical protein AcusKO_42120 [Acuticoccus sp.]